MATAVLAPMSAINLDGGILPSSALTQQHSPRHGRSRAASISKGKGGRGRGYSLVDDRETTVSKAVVFVLKRAGTLKEEEEEEATDEATDDGKIVADAEGWVAVDDVVSPQPCPSPNQTEDANQQQLSHQRVSDLGVTLDELKDLASSSPAAKTRQLSFRQTPDADTYQIRRAPKAPSSSQQPQTLESKTASWQPITAGTEDLPEFIIHETSYPKYHLILASGSIKRAGGQPYLSFAVAQDENARPASSAADVSIWIHLRSALEARPEIVWQRTEAGSVVTADEVPASLWKRAVARRGDLGVLYEDGTVRKEVPVGLRGKGAKAKKGKGVLKNKSADADDGSDSASASE
jgi:2'-phosphotransferase